MCSASPWISWTMLKSYWKVRKRFQDASCYQRLIIVCGLKLNQGNVGRVGVEIKEVHSGGGGETLQQSKNSNYMSPNKNSNCTSPNKLALPVEWMFSGSSLSVFWICSTLRKVIFLWTPDFPDYLPRRVFFWWFLSIFLIFQSIFFWIFADFQDDEVQKIMTFHIWNSSQLLSMKGTPPEKKNVFFQALPELPPPPLPLFQATCTSFSAIKNRYI